VVRQQSDRAPLLVRKVHMAEQEFARTKSVRDLTEVINYSAEAKQIIRKLKVQPEKKKGCPIGQRWE
jgi:hypothetical protein